MNERKAILLRSQHPEIDEICSEISELEEIIEQKKEFSEKQIKNLIIATKKEIEEISENKILPLRMDIEKIVAKEGLVPKGFSLNDKNVTIVCDEGGAIYINKHTHDESCQEHDDGVKGFIKLDGSKMPEGLKKFFKQLLE